MENCIPCVSTNLLSARLMVGFSRANFARSHGISIDLGLAIDAIPMIPAFWNAFHRSPAEE